MYLGLPKKTNRPCVMVKKILVALDPDTDTPIATQYAIDIARRHGASVTGFAVVDTEHIQTESRGGGIGSMYYGEKLRKEWLEETRQRAQELIGVFRTTMEEAGVPFEEYVREGAPYEQIVDEMKYHDLLVIGKTPHFFYGHPEQETNTLARVVKTILGPALVVDESHEPVTRVMIAYDGSNAAARAMQRFVSLQPFGPDLDVTLVNVYRGGDSTASELMLRKASDYLGAHGYRAHLHNMSGDDDAEALVASAEQIDADVIVAGAHAVSKIKKLVFGSTAAQLLKRCPALLFLDA